MPLVLYHLPNWLLGVVITGTWIVIALAGYALFRRLVRHEFDADERALAVALLAVIATVNSLLLAFSAVSVWESFAAADEAVHGEANTITELSQDLAVFDSPESTTARELLRTYTRLVVSEEWAAMQAGRVDNAAWDAFNAMFRSVGALEPDTPRHSALMPEIWARTNELLKHRRERLYTSEAQVPNTLWLVVVVGTVMTICTIYVLPPTRFNTVVVASVAGAMGLVFFFVVAMDRPFAGNESISPAPFEGALFNMQQWDEQTAAEARR
jgi:hypothetical protein